MWRSVLTIVGILTCLAPRTVHAVEATQQLLPGFVGVQTQVPSGTANQLRCLRVVAWFDQTGATKFAGGVTNTVGGATCGFALYPDSDDGDALAVVSGACTAGIIGSSSISAFNLVAGTTYRSCTCSTSISGGYLAVASSAVTGGWLPDLLTEFSSTMVATAATSCTAGVPPTAGTGALTTATDFRPPLVLVEVVTTTTTSTTTTTTL